MSDTRLPRPLEEFLLDVATDHSAREQRRRLLGFGGESHMRDSFMEALASPDIAVHADVCEDDPSEVVVRATGTAADGTSWGMINIILLEPCWLEDCVSQDLADDIVAHWDRLRAIASATAALAAA